MAVIKGKPHNNDTMEDLITKDYTKMSLRNPNISLMSTSEYLWVELESCITKYVREWFTTKYEYFFLPFLLKIKATVFDAEKYHEVWSYKVL
jgi:hypothetical protein